MSATPGTRARNSRPGPHTPSEIARGPQPVGGAVGNALTTLAGRAEASRIAGKPLCYEANSATAAAARSITPRYRPAY